MKYLLSQIAQVLDIAFEGDDIAIDSINNLTHATPHSLSFINADRYIKDLKQTQAGAILLESKYLEYAPKSAIKLITPEPYLKLAYASKLFAHTLSTHSNSPKIGEGCDIDASVRFGQNVTIGNNVTLLANSYVGDNVVIGNNTLIYSNVSIYHHCLIGSNVIIHSGCVIGSDGYGFAHTKSGEHIKIYQNGNAIIEDDVEIGANSTIDRAIFNSTIISKGSKLDNLVQIGHNCIIGENSLLVAQSGLAGSTTTGRNLVMGGQSGSTGHLHIGDFTTIAARGVATKNLEGKKIYSGFPAIEHKVWRKIQAKIAQLIK